MDSRDAAYAVLGRQLRAQAVGCVPGIGLLKSWLDEQQIGGRSGHARRFRA